MVATAFATQRRTRSNVAGDELVLRVSGPTRDGRIVRLKSHKCTIGAGKYCSLRLRAPGVAPLHCLVVRGRAGAVVRRWAADTLLNHQAFDDAPLLPGDRLSVGPVELEVLGVGADPQQPPETSHSDDSARLDELETERQSLDGQRRQWQAEQEESRRKLDEQLSLLTAQAAELESQRSSLAEEYRQRETEQEHSATQATAQTEQLQTRLDELETERQSLDGQRRQWQAEQEESLRNLDEQRSQLTAQAAELESQRSSLAEEYRQRETEQEHSATQATAQTEQLQTRLDELETERQSLDGQRRQWQAEQEESLRNLDEQRSQLTAQAAELESQRSSLAEEYRQRETEQEHSATQATAQTEQLQTRLAELETERQSLDGQRRQWQAEQEDNRRNLDEQRSQLTAQAAELESQRSSLAEEHRQRETEQEHSATQATAQTEQLQTRLAELETERQSLDGQRRQWQAEQEESRRKLDEQLSLLTTQAAELESQRNSLAEEHRQRETEREQHLAAEEYRSEESTPGNEPQAETSDAADGEDNSLLEKGATAGLSSSVGRNTRENTAGQASSGTREESIEEYMGRLMQRTQASSDTSVVPYRSPPAAASGAPATAPVAETMEPSSTAPVPAPQRREPAQVAPRAKAPEKHVNLSAMRELANLSAQNALSRYSRRILVKAMYSKLLVVAVALASAASLLWMWKTTTGWQTTLYLALVALIVAIYWGVQYALLSGRLMINKSGHIQWHSSAGYGNGASKAAESSDEKPSGETASDPRPPNPDPRPPL